MSTTNHHLLNSAYKRRQTMPNKKRKREESVTNRNNNTSQVDKKNRIQTEIEFHLQVAQVLRDCKDSNKHKIDIKMIEQAVRGDMIDQNRLALCYHFGSGIKQNYSTAIQWLMKSVEQGYSKAQYNLGLYYEKGIGVKKNEGEAFKCVLKSARQGFPQAQYVMSTYYETGIGVKKNQAESFNWVLKSAEQGHVLAQFMTGKFYKKGFGVEIDVKQAFKWIEKSACSEFLHAVNIYGLMLIHGHGTTINITQGLKALKSAANKGDKYAMANLSTYYKTQNEADWRAKRWPIAAKDKKHDMTFHEGLCHQSGYFYKKDLHKALSCFQRSAATGNTNAERFLRSLQENMTKANHLKKECDSVSIKQEVPEKDMSSTMKLSL